MTDKIKRWAVMLGCTHIREVTVRPGDEWHPATSVDLYCDNLHHDEQERLWPVAAWWDASAFHHRHAEADTWERPAIDWGR